MGKPLLIQPMNYQPKVVIGGNYYGNAGNAPSTNESLKVYGRTTLEENLSIGVSGSDKKLYLNGNEITGDSGHPGEGENSISLGSDSTVTGEGSTVVGNNNTVSSNESVALGRGNYVTGTSSFAVGNSNEIVDADSSAFGDSNTIDAPNSAVIGNRNEVYGGKSYAFGYQNRVDGNNGVAIGNEIPAVWNNTIVLGGADQNTVVTGNLNIGASGGDKQLFLNEVGIDGKHAGEGLKSICLGTDSTVTGDGSVSVGINDTVSGAQSFVVGKSNNITSSDTNVLGKENNVTGDSSSIVGNYNNIIGSGSDVAFGRGNRITAESSFAVGNYNTINAAGAGAFGYNNTVDGASSVAVGTYISNTEANIIVLGGANQNTVVSGSLSVGDPIQPDKEVQNLVCGEETLIAGKTFKSFVQDDFTGNATNAYGIINELGTPRFYKRDLSNGIDTSFQLSNVNNANGIEEAMLYAQRNVTGEDMTWQQLTVAHDMINVGNRNNLDGKITINGKATIGNDIFDGALEVLGEARIGRVGTETTNLRVYGKADIPGYRKIVDPTSTAQETGETYFGKKVYIITYESSIDPGVIEIITFFPSIDSQFISVGGYIQMSELFQRPIPFFEASNSKFLISKNADTLQLDVV
ncbi:hypothetical protein FACS189472_06250 [Alphaproteobacteria bacterium]|nr:hypothetical protein FACS189472_06250 [Alphaproteobacteria bacterium]